MKLNPKHLIYLFLMLALESCIGGAEKGEYIDLGNKFWYKATSHSTKLIESKTLSHYLKIYPIVTQYSYNNDFIVAEQLFEKDATVAQMGEDFLRRFETYRLYQRDTNILNAPFYAKLRGWVEKDSTLYQQFLAMNASENESENRAIGIILAQQIINSSIQNPKDWRYWIIVHSSHSILGPLSKKEFLHAKDSIGIPEELKLQFER